MFLRGVARTLHYLPASWGDGFKYSDDAGSTAIVQQAQIMSFVSPVRTSTAISQVIFCRKTATDRQLRRKIRRATASINWLRASRLSCTRIQRYS